LHKTSKTLKPLKVSVHYSVISVHILTATLLVLQRIRFHRIDVIHTLKCSVLHFVRSKSGLNFSGLKYSSQRIREKLHCAENNNSLFTCFNVPELIEVENFLLSISNLNSVESSLKGSLQQKKYRQKIRDVDSVKRDRILPRI